MPHSEEGRRALLPDGAESELASYQNHIENCLGSVKIPVGIAGPLRVRGLFASGDYRASGDHGGGACCLVFAGSAGHHRSGRLRERDVE